MLENVLKLSLDKWLGFVKRHTASNSQLFLRWTRYSKIMNTARRCSALFSQLSVSPRGAPTARRPPTPGAVLAPAGTRHCHPGVVGAGGVKGTCPQMNPSGATNSGAAAGTVHSTH